MTGSRGSASQTAFSARIDALTHEAIAEGVVDFAALLCRLPGVYPIELLSSLDRLATAEVIPLTIATSVRRQATKASANGGEGRSFLPLPHPLDFEWRFTPD